MKKWWIIFLSTCGQMPFYQVITDVLEVFHTCPQNDLVYYVWKNVSTVESGDRVTSTISFHMVFHIVFNSEKYVITGFSAGFPQ